MIGFLQGKILDNQVSTEGKLLVGVGHADSGVVGYSAFVPRSVHYEASLPGSAIQLYVHSHVREDAFDLYGFSTTLERDLFLTLLSVNGIGPKAALSVLSHAEPAQVLRAVVEADKDFLTRIPGVGKKTAERVVLELKDKVEKKFGSALGAPIHAIDRLQASRTGQDSSRHVYMDAKAALVSLGFPETKVALVLDKAMENVAASSGKTAEDLIRMALQQL
ncbi:MAG: Holliday junction branch migration protein RuvA [Bacteriovoracia bacterium]